MPFCRACGMKLPEDAQFCGNCGTERCVPEGSCSAPPTYTIPPAPPEVQEKVCEQQIPIRYQRRLKLIPMDLSSKLRLLGRMQWLYLLDLAVLLLTCLFAAFPIYRPEPGVNEWGKYLNKSLGLFGAGGTPFVILTVLLLLTAWIMAAKPLYSRSTYKGIQLAMALLLQTGMFLTVAAYAMGDLGYGTFLGTALSIPGRLLVLLLLGGMALEIGLIVEYEKLRKKNVYQYVAN